MTAPSDDTPSTGEPPLPTIIGKLAAAIYTTDAKGRITYFNEAAVALWGRRPKLHSDLWCGSWKIFEVDGSPLPLDTCPMALVLQGQAHVSKEIVIERPDGTRRFVLPYPEPLLGPSGELIGAVNLLVDVTEQRRMEHQLRVNTELLRTAEERDLLVRKEREVERNLLAAIVESSDDAIISKTLDGIITSWNKGAERILGYTADEVIGRHVSILMPPEYADDPKNILAAIRAGRKIDHYQTRRRRKDGSFVDLSLTVSPICDDCGTIVGASKVARDITAQKQAEEALLERERQLLENNIRKDEFLAMLAHELRNPLAAISSAAHIESMVTLPEAAQAANQVVLRQTKHLARLIDDLLDISRITRGKITLLPEIMDVAPVARSALASIQGLLQERRHQVEVVLEDDVSYVYADPVRLEQVIVNLLVNAAKYTPAGGTIRLSVAHNPSEVVIKVQDDGIGIDPEKLGQMFELFVQGDRTLARSEGGLGLGLTLVKALSEMQNGAVEAFSEGPGKGSTFTVRLPAAMPAHARAVAALALTPG